MLGLGNILTKGGAVIQKFPNEYSFNFDSSNDYLDLNVGNGLISRADIKSDGESFSAWIKLDNVSGTKYIVCHGRGLSENNAVYGGIYVEGTTAKFTLYKNSAYKTVSGTSTLSTDTWYHIVGTYDGENNDDKIRIYINGSLEATSSALGGDFLTGEPTIAHVGRNVNTSSGTRDFYFDGLIDEVAIWDTALDATAIGKIGSKVVDLTKYSASNLKLWLRAGDKVEPETSIARSDFYTDFDGTDDYINVGSDASLDNIWTSGGTLTAWIYPRSDGESDFGMIAVKRSSNASGWYLATNDESSGACDIKLRSARDTADGGWATTSREITLNEWNHIAVSYDSDSDGNSPLIYVNGISVGVTESDTPSGSHSSDASDIFKIGGEAGAFTYDGAISNLALHQTILDSQTISQMAKSRYTPMRDNRFSVVDFDGTNDKITTNADSTRVDATYTYWAKFPSGGANEHIFGHGSATATSLLINAGGSTDKPLLYMGSSRFKYFADTSAQDDNEWHHWALVMDSSSVADCKLYIDGVEVSQSSIGNSGDYTAYSTGLQIAGSGGGFAEVSIAQFAVYSDLKDSEFVSAQWSKGITADYSNDTNLSAYYRMGDDTSKAYPTIADSSSNSNDGTASGAVEAQQMVAGYDMGAFESSSEELSSELIADGDFALTGTQGASTTGTYWSTNGQMTIANGKAHFADTGGGEMNLLGDSPFASTGLYKFQFEVSNTVSGSAKLRIKEGSNILINTTYDDGTHQIYFQITSTGGLFQIDPRKSGGVEHDLSNLSLKKVIQSDLSDTYPAIIDVNEPVLGAEEVTNGGFDSDSSWTKGTGWSIGSGVATAVAGTASYLSQDIGGVENAYYKITLTVTVSASNLYVYFGIGGNYVTISSSGTYTLYNTWSADDSIGLYKHASFAGTVDNVSVKRLFGNTGTMTQMLSSNLVYSSILPDQSFLTGVNSAYNFIDLDGTDAYVQVEQTFTSDNFALSFWINPDDVTGDKYLFDQNAGICRSVIIGYQDGYINFVNDDNDAGNYYPTGTETDTQIPVSVGEWQHYVMMTDGTKVYGYRNGVEVVNITGKWGASGAEKLWIGQYESGNNYNGKITAVGIWNKTLSSSEISAIYTAGRHSNLLDSYSDNLKAYYAFGALDAVTGLADTDSTIYDRSGNSNHGTPSGTATGDLKSPPNAEPEGYAKGDTNRSTTIP